MGNLMPEINQAALCGFFFGAAQMAFSTKDSLDQLLDYAQRYQIFTVPSKELTGCHFPYNQYAVKIGCFVMQVHCHDTGNNVRVYIIGAGAPYAILDGCYWKRSGYDHNPFIHLHGAWDGAFQDAQDLLRKAVEENEKRIEAAKLAAQSEQLSAEERRKREVEALFQ